MPLAGSAHPSHTGGCPSPARRGDSTGTGGHTMASCAACVLRTTHCLQSNSHRHHFQQPFSKTLMKATSVSSLEHHHAQNPLAKQPHPASQQHRESLSWPGSGSIPAWALLGVSAVSGGETSTHDHIGAAPEPTSLSSIAPSPRGVAHTETTAACSLGVPCRHQ